MDSFTTSFKNLELFFLQCEGNINARVWAVVEFSSLLVPKLLQKRGVLSLAAYCHLWRQRKTPGSVGNVGLSQYYQLDNGLYIRCITLKLIPSNVVTLLRVLHELDVV